MIICHVENESFFITGSRQYLFVKRIYDYLYASKIFIVLVAVTYDFCVQEL